MVHSRERLAKTHSWLAIQWKPHSLRQTRENLEAGNCDLRRSERGSYWWSRMCSRETVCARCHEGHCWIACCYLSGGQYLPSRREVRVLTLTGRVLRGIICRIAIIVRLVENTSEACWEFLGLRVHLSRSHCVEIGMSRV